MDSSFLLRIQNLTSEISNQLSKDTIDPYVAKSLMSLAVNRVSLLLTHIGYIESKVDQLTRTNEQMSILIDNLKAENQRLSNNARY